MKSKKTLEDYISLAIAVPLLCVTVVASTQYLYSKATSLESQQSSTKQEKEKRIDELLEDTRISSKSANEHLRKLKEALEEYELLTTKYNLLERDWKESRVTICSRKLPSLENLVVEIKQGKESTTVQGVSIKGWKKWVEPVLTRYAGKQDFEDENFRLDFLIAYSNAFDYDDKIRKDKEWMIRLERSKKNSEELQKTLQELIKILKKPGIIDLLETIETNPSAIPDMFEESYKKSINYDPEDLKSRLQLEVYQLTNPLSTGTWYPPQQFYSELLQLFDQAGSVENTETKKKAVTRYLNLAIGYARHRLPPQELQIPLLFKITRLGYSPRELRKMIIL